MGHVLGLDIGTNSIGWALLSDNEIIDKGVNIFPIGTNLDKGIREISKNSQRGGYRRARRNLFRYKLRRKRLKTILSSINMLPDFQLLQKKKDVLQATDLCKLRAKALDSKITLEDIGRIFLLINKHRGFKSNSKTLSIIKEADKDEDGKVKAGIDQLTKFLHNSSSRTVGEYFNKMYLHAQNLHSNGEWHNADEPFDERAIHENGSFSFQNCRGIRRENGRYVSRAMYENEFDLIWEQQKKCYPQLTGSKKEYDEIIKILCADKKEKLAAFKNTLYWQIKNYIIFYQRPLKSQKKFIGKCSFEKNKRTAPISSLLFQDFRIWKQLADIRFTDKKNSHTQQALPLEWKQKIAAYLQTNPSLPLRAKKNKTSQKKTDLSDVLGLNGSSSIEFNFDNEDDDKSFEGNRTLSVIYIAVGPEIFEALKNNAYPNYPFKNGSQLDALWHTLYMAQDDVWLEDALLCKWKFDNQITKRLLSIGFEEGYANYSSKVLNKVLPYMLQGKDESDALVMAGYLKSPDEVREEIILNKKITQLNNNELRNPVVEKAVSQTIKLVNAIIQNSAYNIRQESLVIRIESTREFKKPKAIREEMRRKNTATDTDRQRYADFLNEKRAEGKLNFSRTIYKHDSIINKFELWLEMGRDNADPLFSELETEKSSAEKHKLWLECGRICPYSNQIISLTKLFSPDIEIEHIIPYSKSLDDSFQNKTLTFSAENKKKANLTSYEYMIGKGDVLFKEFQKRVAQFKDKTKKTNFLREDIKPGFSNDQINNTSYIAKYVKKKLEKVCRDVQFTNGNATAELRKNDWKLGSILDTVRYEEETGIDIDKCYDEFYLFKRDFEAWRKRKANSTDLAPIKRLDLTRDLTSEYEAENNNPLYEWKLKIDDFEKFRGEKGKKDRSDHRHHLLDAIITASCSRSIIQKLSTYSATRETQGLPLYDEKGRLTREKVECPLSYIQIKKALKDVLVYHKAEQRLLTSKLNKIKVKKAGEDKHLTPQKTYSVRGSLVKDNFYGKLKMPQNQGFDKADVYVKRVNLTGETFKDEKSLDKIVDQNVKELLKRRLLKYGGNGEKAFNTEALINDPVFLYSLADYPDGIPTNPSSKKGNPLPVIKKVRVANKNVRNLVQLKATDENNNIAYENRYAETDGNYIMVLYERREKDKKGKLQIKRDFEILSFYEAVILKKEGKSLFPDEKKQKDGTYLPLMKSCPYLKPGDMVIMYEKNEDEIDWRNLEDLKKRLFVIVGFNSIIPVIKGKEYIYGLIKLAKHNFAKANAVYKGSLYKHDILTTTISNYHTQINAVKVQISITGEITKKLG